MSIPHQPIPTYPIPNMNLPLPPPPTMTTTHLHIASPPSIQLQAAPPPRHLQQQQQQIQIQQTHRQQQTQHQRSPPPQPQSQKPDLSTLQPNDKSQDDWLRDCGHSSLQNFMDYYGFDSNIPEDVAMGKGFLQQIRRQEQEVWEQRQANRGRALTNTGVNTTMNSGRMSGFGHGNGGGSRGGFEDAYAVKGYQLEDMRSERGGAGGGLQMGGMQMGMVGRSMQQQKQQIPRSSADPRFHVPVATMAGRGVSENMLNAYGMKPWELEAGGRVHAEYSRYER